MSDTRPIEYRAIWQDKPVLRKIYNDYYRRIAAYCVEGKTLEVGGGSGNFKSFRSDVISSDILPASWLDAVADAQALPFARESFDNIVMVDVLHHLETPARFFKEAQEILKPGGRIIMLEPAITPLSWFFYNFFHPEPVELFANPLADAPHTPGRDPFDANQAIPTLLFRRNAKAFARRFSALRLVALKRLSLFAYPLSGGFRPWQMIPARMVAPLLKLEEKLIPFLGRAMAFRLLIVLEKNKD